MLRRKDNIDEALLGLVCPKSFFARQIFRRKLTVLRSGRKSRKIKKNRKDQDSEKNYLFISHPHSTVMLREYFKNILLKSWNIARIFIKLLERFLKYCRNLAMSAQKIINVMLLTY